MKVHLTPREREVLLLVREGKAGRAIQNRRGIAQVTLTQHLRNLYEKAGVHSRVELALKGASWNDDWSDA